MINHPTVEQLGQYKIDELFMYDAKYFGYINEPLITEDGYVLINSEYVEVAREISMPMIPVTIISNTTKNDVIRLCIWQARPLFRKNKRMLYNAIKILEYQLWNTPEGQEWAKGIPGDNINQKIGSHTGYSESTISLVKSIGNNDTEILYRVDDPDDPMTLTLAQQYIANRDDPPREKYADADRDNTNDDGDDDEDDDDNDDDDDDDNGENDDENNEGGDESGNADDANDDDDDHGKENGLGKKKKPEEPVRNPFPLKTLAVEFEDIGEFIFADIDGARTVKFKDIDMGEVFVKPDKHNSSSEAIAFVIQHPRRKWSCQIILRNASYLINKKGGSL